MDLQLQRIKTGDLLLSTSRPNINSLIVRTFMMSSFNHSACFVWINNLDKEKISITDKKVEDKFRLAHENENELFVLEVSARRDEEGGGNYIRLIPYEKIAKYNDRCLHRGLNYSADDRLDKFKKFFKYYRGSLVGTSKELFLSCWLHPVHPDSEKIFEKETCTSFYLLWLKMLGYSNKEEGVPYRARQLYSPDHLLVKYNKSSLLDKRETILKNNIRTMTPFVFCLVVFVVVLIFVIMIVMFIYLPLNESITNTKNQNGGYNPNLVSN